VLLLLYVFGIGIAAGAAIAVAAHRVLRRADPGREARWAALLAGAIAAVTWVAFALDRVFYSVLENQPSYYPHSDYVEYRRALEGLAGIALGVGYAVLAGSLVAVAELVRRRRGPAAGAAAGTGALFAMALPLAVPAALPRDEYGKDAVFYVSDAGNVEFQPYFPKVCFAYGIQRPPAETLGGPEDPEVCLEFRPTRVSRALVEESLPSEDQPTVYDVQNELNESDLRPLDPVEPSVIDIEGLELERAQWTGASPPPTARLADPPSAVEEIGEARKRALERGLLRRDRATKARILRVERYLRRCRARTGDYRPCVDGPGLRRLGVPIGRGPDQVRVSARGARSYAISSFSRRAGSFSLGAGPEASNLRVCDIRGSGGCPRSGMW
jgi:hypothetical protein